VRILHTVEFYHPSVGGAQEVVRQISERLVRRGHDVTVATTWLAERTQSVVEGVRIAQFPITGNAARGIQGPTSDYQAFLLSGQFDIMLNYAAQQWATDLVFPLLGRLPYPTVMAPCGFSGLRQPQYSSYFKQMPAMLAAYDGLIFHSDSYQDAEFARHSGLRDYHVVPNGASETEFININNTFRQRHLIPDSIPLLLTVGTHTGLKGHALVIEAFRRARIGRAMLVIIGNSPGGSLGCLPNCRMRARYCAAVSLGRKRVLLLDPPRADVVTAYQAADLFVFGSNVECSPLVLFEAMASQTPFVTVACGNAEEIVRWGQGGMVVPTYKLRNGRVTAAVATFARSIEQLVMNRAECERLSISGYTTWKEQFTWDTIAMRYEQIYWKLVSKRDAASKVNGRTE